MTTIKLGGKLPKTDDRNGLHELYRDFVRDPSRSHVVIAVIDTAKVINDIENYDTIPQLRILAIEPISGDDAGTLRAILQRHHADRPGARCPRRGSPSCDGSSSRGWLAALARAVGDRVTAPDARQADDLRGLIAERLADHRGLPLRISAVAFPGCTCGWLYPAEKPGDLRMLAWQEHRADALLPVVTAWHEKAADAQARTRAAEELREAAADWPPTWAVDPATYLRDRAAAVNADDRRTTR